MKNIFEGESFNSAKQVGIILKRKDSKDKTIQQLCEESFNRALNSCQMRYSRYGRKAVVRLNRRLKDKRKEGLLLKNREDNKAATISNLKADIYARLNKKVTIDDISLVVEALFESMKKYILDGVSIKISTFFELFLKPSKPIFNGITRKYRTGIMRLSLKSNVRFRKEISQTFPCEEYSKEEFENPYKNVF